MKKRRFMILAFVFLSLCVVFASCDKDEKSTATTVFEETEIPEITSENTTDNSSSDSAETMPDVPDTDSENDGEWSPIY